MSGTVFRVSVLLLSGVVYKLSKRKDGIKMKFCEKCGTKLAEDIKFCPNCGNKVEMDISSDQERPVTLGSDSIQASSYEEFSSSRKSKKASRRTKILISLGVVVLCIGGGYAYLKNAAETKMEKYDDLYYSIRRSKLLKADEPDEEKIADYLIKTSKKLNNYSSGLLIDDQSELKKQAKDIQMSGEALKKIVNLQESRNLVTDSDFNIHKAVSDQTAVVESLKIIHDHGRNFLKNIDIQVEEEKQLLDQLETLETDFEFPITEGMLDPSSEAGLDVESVEVFAENYYPIYAISEINNSADLGGWSGPFGLTSLGDAFNQYLYEAGYSYVDESDYDYFNDSEEINFIERDYDSQSASRNVSELSNNEIAQRVVSANKQVMFPDYPVQSENQNTYVDISDLKQIVFYGKSFNDKYVANAFMELAEDGSFTSWSAQQGKGVSFTGNIFHAKKWRAVDEDIWQVPEGAEVLKEEFID